MLKSQISHCLLLHHLPHRNAVGSVNLNGDEGKVNALSQKPHQIVPHRVRQLCNRK